jgi:hypothetical protein
MMLLLSPTNLWAAWDVVGATKKRRPNAVNELEGAVALSSVFRLFQRYLV